MLVICPASIFRRAVMIVVTTPTGDIGARVLSHLVKSGEDLRVIVRDVNYLPADVRERADVVEGSHANSNVIEKAIDGAKRVFWLPPGSPTEPSAEAAYVDFSRAFSMALPKSSVTHVVGISALGRGWSKPAGHVTASLKMDDMIGATGVHYRALACASLMDNMMRQADPIREQNAFYQPTPGDVKLPHVAKADVAAIAVRLLLNPVWTGVEEVSLLGPEDLSFNEIAGIMTDVLGSSVHFHEMPMEQFEQMMASFGTSAGMVEAYSQMLTAKNEGMDTIHGVTDRSDTPTTFRAWCERELRPAVQVG